MDLLARAENFTRTVAPEVCDRLSTELRQARLTVRAKLPVESLSGKLADLPDGVSVERDWIVESSAGRLAVGNQPARRGAAADRHARPQFGRRPPLHGRSSWSAGREKRRGADPLFRDRRGGLIACRAFPDAPPSLDRAEADQGKRRVEERGLVSIRMLPC